MGDQNKICSPGKTGCSSDGYLTAKMGMLVADPALKSVAERSSLVGKYFYFKAEHIIDPEAERFLRSPGYTRAIYNAETWTGRDFERYIPDKFRPIEQHVDEMKSAGARLQSSSLWIKGGLRAVRLGIDAWALEECVDSGCSNMEVTAIMLDGTSVAVDGSAKFIAAGASGVFSASLVSESTSMIDEAMATQLVNAAKLRVGAGLLVILSSGVQFYIEMDHFNETGDMNGAAITYSASNALNGVWIAGDQTNELLQLVKNKNFLKTSSMAVFDDVALSVGMEAFLRYVGWVAAGIGVAFNGGSIIYNIFFEEDLSEEQVDKQILSGSMGLASAILFALGTGIVIKLAAPLMLTAFIASNILFCIRAVYDHYDEFGVETKKEELMTVDDGLLHIGNQQLPECDKLIYLGGLDYWCETDESFEAPVLYKAELTAGGTTLKSTGG